MVSIKGLKTTIAWCLANLVLLTSTGVLVNLHYCLGHLKSVGIYAEAKPCTAATCNEYSKNSQCTKITKHSCCQNAQIAFKQFIEYNGLQSFVLIAKMAPNYVHDNQFIQLVQNQNFSQHCSLLIHAPPNFFNTSIKVLYQVFRL